MTLEAFLQRHSTSLDQLIDGARTVVPLAADDRLIAVGSLAEGLGNGKSDVDLLYLTPDLRHADASPEQVRSFAAGRCVVDLRIIPTGYASALRSRLRSWAEGEWSLNVAADFTPGDVLLLHRLRAGITLWPDSIGPESALDRDVARLKLHVARHMARTLQVDMAGYREVGDGQSLVYAGQDLLGHAADGLLAGFGFTNPTAKWRSRLLDRLPHDWEGQLVRRPNGLVASALYWQLHRAPAQPTLDAAIEHGCRIVTFARAAFLSAEERLVHAGANVGRTFAWRNTSHSGDDSPLPFLDLDVDFCRMEDGVVVARLNEFGERLQMGFEDFAITLLFDNVTTASEAARAISVMSPVSAPNRHEQFARAVCGSSFVLPDPRNIA